jgi:hypothetical protein
MTSDDQDYWQSIETLERILRTELKVRDKRLDELDSAVQINQRIIEKQLLPRFDEITHALKAVEASNAALAQNLLEEISSRQRSDSMASDQHATLMNLLAEFQTQLAALSKQHNHDMQDATAALTKHTKNESFLTKLLVKMGVGFGIGSVILAVTLAKPHLSAQWFSGIIQAILTFPG